MLVTFTPTEPGQRSGVLFVTSNDPMKVSPPRLDRNRS